MRHAARTQLGQTSSGGDTPTLVENVFNKTKLIFDNETHQDHELNHVDNILEHDSKEKRVEYRLKMSTRTSVIGQTLLKKPFNPQVSSAENDQEVSHKTNQEENISPNNRRHQTNIQEPPEGGIRSKPTSSQKNIFQDLLVKMLAKRCFRQWHKFMPHRMIKVLNRWHYNLLSDKTIWVDQEKKEEFDLQEEKLGQTFGEGRHHNNVNEDRFYLSEMKVPLEEIRKQHEMSNYLKNLLFKSIPMISASGNFRLIWDIIQMINIMAFQCFLPLYITFNVAFYDIVPTNVSFTMYLLLLGDVLVSMHTSYYDKGKQVTNRKRVIYKYLKTEFTHDLLVLLPITIDMFFIQFTSFYPRLLFLLAVLKLRKMYDILSKIQDRFHLIRYINSYMQLFKLLIVHLLVSHYFSCLWVFVGTTIPGYTWMVRRDIVNVPWPVQYINSYYFITLTMITVGYGDITPVNNIEIGLCIGIMTFACGVFAYSVTEIGTLIQDLRKNQKEINKNLQTIQKYMHNKNISTGLKYEIREYLLYYWKEESNKDGEKENIIINQLSDSLKETLIMEANHIVLSDSPVFRDNFSPEVLKKTVPLIKEFRCTPEEVIYCEGERDEGNIYFIEKGSIELYIDTSSNQSEQTKALKTLKKGDNFGAIGFFTGLHRNQSVRSLEFTTLLMIKRDEFLAVLKEYPEDYERFCYLRDKIMILNDYEKLGLRCYSCRSFFHQLNDCPYLHFVPNKFKVIHQANSGTNARQNKFQRISIVKYKSALNIQSDIEQQARIYYEENEDIIDYLYGDINSQLETQLTTNFFQESDNYLKFESLGGGCLNGNKDNSLVASQVGLLEEEVNTNSVKNFRRGKTKNLTAIQQQQQQPAPSYQQLLPKMQSEDFPQGFSSPSSVVLPTPEIRKNERKGTIQIQNHRNERRNLTRQMSAEKIISVDNIPTEKNLTMRAATITCLNPIPQNNTNQQQQNQQQQQQQNEKEGITLSVESDSIKKYLFYFPDNNFEIVLAKANKKVTQNNAGKSLIRKSKRSTIKSMKIELISSMNSLLNKYEHQKEEGDEPHLTLHNGISSRISLFSGHATRKRSTNVSAGELQTKKIENSTDLLNGEEKPQQENDDENEKSCEQENLIDESLVIHQSNSKINHNQFDISIQNMRNSSQSQKNEESIGQSLRINCLHPSSRLYFTQNKLDEEL